MNEEELKTELMEGMLEHTEGRKSFRSVVVLGMNAHSKNRLLKDQYLREVVSELNIIGNEIGRGKKYSREQKKEIFTTMLEKLIKS